MEGVLEDLDRAISAKAYFAALTLALTLPDICGRCERRKPEKGDLEAYKSWFHRYVTPRWDSLTASDCYYLRCGIVHQGLSRDRKIKEFTSIHFALPGTVYVDDVYFDGAFGSEKFLQIDLVRFCNAISDSVKAWLVDKNDNQIVQTNIKNLNQYRMFVMPLTGTPYPVIAPLEL